MRPSAHYTGGWVGPRDKGRSAYQNMHFICEFSHSQTFTAIFRPLLKPS
jgi:hypothetical protein